MMARHRSSARTGVNSVATAAITIELLALIAHFSPTAA